MLVIFTLYVCLAVYLMKKYGLKASQVIVPLLFFVVICTISLSQNYTLSLLPGNDGIGISNFLAKLILPDNSWTHAMFESYFTTYLAFSIALVVVYVISFVIDRRGA